MPKAFCIADLKPANIMLDGGAKWVMTDFGLAGLTDQNSGLLTSAAEPRLHGPEQLAGKEVTAQSDLYSLVWFFMKSSPVSGRLPPKLCRIGARRDLHSEQPSSVVKDSIRRLSASFLRCLEAEPGSRPESALRVAGALPGGDPLAAALAAANALSRNGGWAGETAGLASRIAMACLAAILIGLAGAVYVAIQHSALDRNGRGAVARSAGAESPRDDCALWIWQASRRTVFSTSTTT